MSHHWIPTPSHKRLKCEDMRIAILTHILDGHCVINSKDIINDQQSGPPTNTVQRHTGCKDVHHAIDPDSDIPDQEMKVAILEALIDELPCLLMLYLFGIQKIDHNPEDSLSSLPTKLQSYINSLKSTGDTLEHDDVNKPEHNSLTTTQWPKIVPQSLKDKIASLFLEETLSQSLQTFTCASCGEACLLCICKSCRWVPRYLSSTFALPWSSAHSEKPPNCHRQWVVRPIMWKPHFPWEHFWP